MQTVLPTGGVRMMGGMLDQVQVEVGRTALTTLLPFFFLFDKKLAWFCMNHLDTVATICNQTIIPSSQSFLTMTMLKQKQVYKEIKRNLILVFKAKKHSSLYGLTFEAHFPSQLCYLY